MFFIHLIFAPFFNASISHGRKQIINISIFILIIMFNDLHSERLSYGASSCRRHAQPFLLPCCFHVYLCSELLLRAVETVSACRAPYGAFGLYVRAVCACAASDGCHVGCVVMSGNRAAMAALDRIDYSHICDCFCFIMRSKRNYVTIYDTYLFRV